MRNNLIEFRKKLGMTQDQLGNILGISKQKVSFTELGTRKGDPEEWLKMQKVFNLSYEETLKLMEMTTNEKLS